MKENTILSGNCKCLDQRAREESTEKVCVCGGGEPDGQKSLYLGRAEGPSERAWWTNMTRPIL